MTGSSTSVFSSRSTGARWWPLFLLAAGNVGRSWLRLLPLIGIGACLAAVALQLSAGALDTHLRSEFDRLRDGSNIVIGRSELGIDATACERLGTIAAVRHAGWLRAGDGSMEVRPGVSAQGLDASPGMIRLLSERHGPIPDVTYGDGLAGRLSIRASETIGILEGPSNRTQQATSAVLFTAVHGQRADECWLETRPETFPLASPLIESALLGSSPDLQVTNLVFNSGPSPYRGPAFDMVGLIGGLLVGLVAALTVRLRRIDLAMHRLIGFNGRQVWAIMMLELSWTLVTGIVMGSTAWLVRTGFDGSPIERPVVATAVYVFGTVLLVAILISGLVIAVLSRRSSQLMVLREGA